MAAGNFPLHAFNRGIVSPRALARVDLERMRLSAETQTNWSPRSLGSMSLRPGLGYICETKDNDAAVLIPFFYSSSQKALLECTDQTIRVLIDGEPIERNSVATVVTNGDFSSATGWTVTTAGGATGSITGGKLVCSSSPIDSYVVTSRTVSVAGGDVGVEHAFRIVVDRGPVVFRCGGTSGGDEFITETTLGTGEHSLAFTPTTTTVYIQFESRVSRATIVDSITVESAGVMLLSSNWTESDLPFMRWSQSGDIVFVSCYGQATRKIERRATRSWSLVLYDPVGPFSAISSDANIKMSISTGAGSATLSASRPFFSSTHVGSQFRIFTPGYNHVWDLGQDRAYTPAIRVNGVGSGRDVDIVTTGTWAGTLNVQKSFTGDDTGFVDIGTTITTNTTTTVTDSADNTVMWLRVGFNTSGFTSGLAQVQIKFGDGGSPGYASGFGSTTSVRTSTGGRTGVCRITAVTDPQTATVEVLSIFSSSVQSADWFEGEWSDRKGWPSANGFYDGRLFFAGRDRIWGSISDSFSSFDPSQEGDSGPIQRSIGYGPVQTINWVLPLSRLLLGTEATEVCVKSSSFDEPLTPTNFSLKDVSTYGSAQIAAIKFDTRGLFVEKAGVRVMELSYDVSVNDYIARDLTQLVPDLNVGNPIVQVLVQRQPDTRFHCIREDGTVAVLVFDPLEDVKCWVEYETDGFVEGGAVLPDSEEDAVYYIVRRTIDGSTKRFIEKFALESECVGGTLNKQADCFVTVAQSPDTTVNGLDHLEGEQVIVWADGSDLSPDVDGVQRTYFVAAGRIALDVAVRNVVVGLPYEARFKSAKLAYAAQQGTALSQKKKLYQLGLLLYKTHARGLYHGPDFDRMDCLPEIERGTTVDGDYIHDQYDEDMMEHPGDWDTDSRLCLKAKAPRPCTVMGAVINMKTHG